MRYLPSSNVHAALKKKFPSPEYALFWEVGNATGGRHSRSADAVVMGLWPSRGIELQGIEVKVDRRDWLRELKDPAKADEIAKFCDRWWLAVSDASIVKDGELPETWGLLVLDEKGQTLRAAKAAPKLEPPPLPRSLLAAILRRAHEGLDALVQNAVLEQTERTAQKEHDRVEELYQLRQTKNAYERLKQDLERFEAKSGIRITGYDGERLGDAVAMLGRLRALKEDPAEHLDAVAAALESHLAEVRNSAWRIREARSKLEPKAAE